jgi:dTDP-4-amino-4,6-dideoxygalactose transaminase
MESHVYHLFVIRVKNRIKFQAHLNSVGIETLIHYPIPVHHQIAYSEYNYRTYPLTEMIHQEVVSLPISPLMSIMQAQEVIDAVNSYQ